MGRKIEKNISSLTILIFASKCDIYLLTEKLKSGLIIKAVTFHRTLTNPDSCLPACVCQLNVTQF